MFPCLLTAVSCARFAVLIAGSHEWWNYRHQADIFTFYHKLLDRGYDPNNIVMIAYDDVVNDEWNKYKGQMFHTTDHKFNVYPGSDKILFREKDVIPENYAKLLTTDLKSTTSDDLFMYFEDHGGYGFINFPETEMMADDLNNALLKMEENGKYGRFLFGISACYSGSVGEKITTKNTVILTAANNHESSYSAVFDDDLLTYLSNEFAMSWFDCMDQDPKMTIGDFYDGLKEKTKLSHACFYGDSNMRKLTIDTFFGVPKKQIDYKPMKRSSMYISPLAATYSSLMHLAKSNDISLRARARLTIHELESLSKKMNLFIDSLISYFDIKNIDSYTMAPGPVTSEYYHVYKHFSRKFGKMNNDDLDKLIILANIVSKFGENSVITAINLIL